MPGRYPLGHGHRQAIDLQNTARLERFERRRHVVAIADHERRLHWFTPLARKPPSTARTWPVTNDAASEARYTAAPTSSSTRPKRFIGVRASSSWPRGVSRSAVFRFVRNTPGAIEFTVTLCGAHSTASARVRPATADLLATYAATSWRPTNDDSDPIVMIRPDF